MRARVSSLVKGDWQVHENRLSARACRDSLMRSETCGQERELNLVHIPHRNLPLHVYASVTEYWLYTSMILSFKLRQKNLNFPPLSCASRCRGHAPSAAVQTRVSCLSLTPRLGCVWSDPGSSVHL